MFGNFFLLLIKDYIFLNKRKFEKVLNAISKFCFVSFFEQMHEHMLSMVAFTHSFCLLAQLCSYFVMRLNIVCESHYIALFLDKMSGKEYDATKHANGYACWLFCISFKRFCIAFENCLIVYEFDRTFSWNLFRITIFIYLRL